MEALNIELYEMKEYINAAFEKDNELIGLYDKSVGVETLEDICDNVFEKISSLIEPAELRGVEVDGKKIGYFVYTTEVLTSFGLNKEYRTKEYLSEFWELIKVELGGTFTCALFGHNVRAINWLKEKCGMKIIFENVTILQCH